MEEEGAMRDAERRAEGLEQSFGDDDDSRGKALDGAERVRVEKRATRGRERETGRKDTILTVMLWLFQEGRELR
jgi:hypothetical protein